MDKQQIRNEDVPSSILGVGLVLFFFFIIDLMVARYFYYLLSVTILVALFSQEGSSQELTGKPIRIGVIQSLTGIAAEDGKTVVQSLQLAAEDFNKAHGNSQVELLVEDDTTQPKNSVSALEKLSTQGVDAVVGATWDFTTNAILAIAARKGLVIFNTSTLMESLTLADTLGFGFINSISANDEASAFDKYLTKRKIKSMTVVFANNSWGETQLKVYKSIAAKNGIVVLDEYRSTSFDANDWSTFITRIKQKKVDVVLLLLNKNDLETFLRRAHEQGLQTSYFASKNLFDAIRIASNKSLFEGACFTYPFEQLGRESEFRSRYKERFGEDARIYADNTYDALFIIADAVNNSRKKQIPLKDAFKLTKHEGLVGTYEFSDNKSFSLGSSSLVCVKSGEVKLEN